MSKLSKSFFENIHDRCPELRLIWTKKQINRAIKTTVKCRVAVVSLDNAEQLVSQVADSLQLFCGRGMHSQRQHKSPAASNNNLLKGCFRILDLISKWAGALG